MIRNATACAAALLFLAGCDPPPEPPVEPPIAMTGTFENLRNEQETGGLLGTQVTLLPGPDRTPHAVFLHAEGTAGPAVFAPVTYDTTGDCHRVTFHAGTPYHADFTGCLGNAALVGRLRYSNGTEEKIYLQRQLK
jgi:hypothetical protein